MKISKLIILCVIISFYSCNKDKSAWESAQSNNTIASYKDYISKFPDGNYKNKAENCIEVLVWKEVKLKNTIEDFNKFIADYPKASQIEDAKQNIYTLAYNQAQGKNTIEAYEQFIATYPEANQVQQAKKNIEKINYKVTDIDGNVYHAVIIGSQTWLKENLKTTRYRNGVRISNITDNLAWHNATSGAWCDFDNSATNGNKYGHLYNWYAVSDTRNIAPLGWHVATDAEWTTLVDYVSANPGNSRSAAKALASTTDWETTNQNTNAIGYNLSLNNSSGFSALPGGNRNYDNSTVNFTSGIAFWWSSTQTSGSSTWAWYRYMYPFNSDVGRSYGGETADGFSVRCIKDN